MYVTDGTYFGGKREVNGPVKQCILHQYSRFPVTALARKAIIVPVQAGAEREELEDGGSIVCALLSETFQYVTTVPEDGTRASPWTMESRELFKSTDNQFDQTRLVGWKPLLHINDAGMTPNPSFSRPAVLRSELRLVATDKKYASQESASYFFDKALFCFLRAGDVFHMVQTERGFGASAIRKGKLLFAVGQVTAVPLGSGIAARVPMDLLQDAQEVFRRRAAGFEFPELPIELRIGDRSSILYRGTTQGDGYTVRIESLERQNVDGASPECASISLDGACDWVAASATALLLSMA